MADTKKTRQRFPGCIFFPQYVSGCLIREHWADCLGDILYAYDNISLELDTSNVFHVSCSIKLVSYRIPCVYVINIPAIAVARTVGRGRCGHVPVSRPKLTLSSSACCASMLLSRHYFFPDFLMPCCPIFRGPLPLFAMAWASFKTFASVAGLSSWGYSSGHRHVAQQ